MYHQCNKCGIQENTYLELLLVSVVCIYIKNTQSYQVGVSITRFHGNLVWLININPTEEICVLLYNTYLCYIYNRDRYVQSKSIIKYLFYYFLWQCQLNFAIGNEKSFCLIYTQRITKNLGTTLVLKGFCCIIIK